MLSMTGNKQAIPWNQIFYCIDRKMLKPVLMSNNANEIKGWYNTETIQKTAALPPFPFLRCSVFLIP